MYNKQRFNPRRDRQFSLLAFVCGFLLCHVLTIIRPLIENSIPSRRQAIPLNTTNSFTSAFEDLKRIENSVKVPPTNVKYCEDDSHHHGPCIFDIGHNSGQDTRNYLTNYPGSRVVAIEANPTLVSSSRQKFESSIVDGRLKLVGIGLTPATDAKEKKKLKFYVNVNDKFSSFEENLGCRNWTGGESPPGNRKFCSVMELDTKSCKDLIEEYGTPAYMKIDIEGMDRACLQALEKVDKVQRPMYTSIENVNPFEVDLLLRLGYTKFKVVNQNMLQEGTTSEEEGHSGPWGEDAEDSFVGKKWQTVEELRGRMPLPLRMMVKGKQRTAWYDLHASM